MKWANMFICKSEKARGFGGGLIQDMKLTVLLTIEYRADKKDSSK